ncbi:MAG: hypothetical protein FWG36_01785 [Oscillospiraceae bacterium]|nr:hypothetical protein [Oscillospiraceae bacterium]
MTALIWLGSIALFLTALLSLKVGLRVKYGDDLKTWLIIGPIRRAFEIADDDVGDARTADDRPYTDTPTEPTDTPTETDTPTDDEIDGQSAGDTRAADDRPYTEPSTEPTEPPAEPTFFDRYDKKKLIKLAFRAVKSFAALLRVDTLEFHYIAGGKSADKTAIAYGRMCAALGAALPFIENNLRVKKRHITTDLDFAREESSYAGTVQITVRIGAALTFGIWAVIEFLKCRKKT